MKYAVAYEIAYAMKYAATYEEFIFFHFIRSISLNNLIKYIIIIHNIEKSTS